MTTSLGDILQNNNYLKHILRFSYNHTGKKTVYWMAFGISQKKENQMNTYFDNMPAFPDNPTEYLNWAWNMGRWWKFDAHRPGIVYDQVYDLLTNECDEHAVDETQRSAMCNKLDAALKLAQFPLDAISRIHQAVSIYVEQNETIQCPKYISCGSKHWPLLALAMYLLGQASSFEFARHAIAKAFDIPSATTVDNFVKMAMRHELVSRVSEGWSNYDPRAFKNGGGGKSDLFSLTEQGLNTFGSTFFPTDVTSTELKHYECLKNKMFAKLPWAHL